MRRLIALLLLVSTAAFGTDGYNVGIMRPRGSTGTAHWIFSARGSLLLPTSAATNYWTIDGAGNTGVSAGEAVTGEVFPVAGTISDFSVDLVSDIGTAGDDAQFTLMVDTSGIGSTSATAIDCTISGGAGTESSCSYVGTLSIGAGDRVTGRLIVSATPASNVRAYVRMKVTPSTARF